MADCREAYLFICDNLDENLDSPRCREIRKHLDACPACRAFLRSVKHTVTLFREDRAPKVPRSTHRVLMEAIGVLRKEPAGRAGTRSRRETPPGR